MHQAETNRVGIGFATGRKSFQKILKTYVYSWRESGLVDDQSISLNLFVAYDLAYYNTKRTDYTNVNPDLARLIDSACFIGNATIKREVDQLIDQGVIDAGEARMLFGNGYAARRNAVLLFAIKNRMDCLLFLDDDEYPMAVTKTRRAAIWSGQYVLPTHIRNIPDADITHGYHCGYISPIPYIAFNDTMKEADLRTFIEAISNDIVNWDTISSVMKNGGVTYADTHVLIEDKAFEVEEINRAKFISGSNLCLNLRDPRRVIPFYNPPKARGEDTFLSTCLSERVVKKVPCYAFHDGFSTYNHLLDGVLPIELKFIAANSEQVINRFYSACIGWIRYKPLFLYITQPEQYEEKIALIREQLRETLPKVSAYFDEPAFFNVAAELEKYHKNVEKHHAEFVCTQQAWAKIMQSFYESSHTPD